MPYSTIRPAIFSASLLAAAREVRASRTWTGLAGSGRMALIDRRDAAEAGLRTLTDPALWGAHHDLTGPALMSWPEALELLAAERGEPVAFRVAADRQFLERLIGEGGSAGTAELFITREWAILAGENDYTTETFQTITGRPPTPSRRVPSRLPRGIHLIPRVWDACHMPWTPELFTWPALQPLLDARRVDKLVGLGRSGFGEAAAHSDGPAGRVTMPFATVTARASDGGIDEFRVYPGTLPLTGRRAVRPPLLQPDPDLREPDIVAEYGRALAAGDVDGVVAAFGPEGYVRDATGTKRPRSGEGGLRRHHGDLPASGGIVQADEEEAFALEYNVVRWGAAELPPQAGMPVLVRGSSGRLEAVRVDHDLEPPATAAGR